MTSVLLISRSHEYENRLQLIFGVNLTRVKGAFLTFGVDVVLQDVDARQRPDVVFLGPHLAYAGTKELSAGLRDRYPGVRIVFVHENAATIEAWIADLGADAVISPTADAEAVRALVERLGRRPDGTADETQSGDGVPHAGDPEHELDTEPASTPADGFAPVLSGALEEAEHFVAGDRAENSVAGNPNEPAELPEPARVIAVVSPKGGLGKTTVATNLAVGLAKHASDSVVLVDGDVQFGDVATALALAPTHTLPDMVSGLAPQDDMVLKALLTPHPSGFYAVCGADSPADGDRVTGEQFTHLIQQLAGIFRYVIIDTSPGLGEHALAALDQATDAVFLCSLGVPNLRALRKELGVLSSIGAMPPAQHIVLNLADRDSGLSRRDAEATIGAAVDVVIPRSKAVPLSTNRGIPLLQEKSRDKAAKSLTQLVGRVELQADTPAQRTETRKAVA